MLSGRNHHQLGMGGITEGATGFPGYNSIWGQDNASIAQILRASGYSTAAIGKWHDTPDWGKPNTRVIGRKVSGFREGDWADGDFAETTKGAPEAIIGSAIGRLPHRKWLDFVSPDAKSEVASDLWALGILLVNRLRPKQGLLCGW
jgi:hypothetical protein